MNHRASFFNHWVKLLTAVGLACVLAGCATSPEDDSENWSATKLYDAAKSALKTADYETTLKHLETLESRYPFGRYAQQAQLDIIYAYFKYDEPESAITAADRFIKLYPRHPHVDYAYYMRGLASFDKGMGSLEYLLNMDPTTRDSKPARESFEYFRTLISQFPKSPYAADAAQRLTYLHENLGKYELHVAEFYLKRGAYVGAINRAKQVIEKYHRTPAARDALAVLYRAYTQLGLDDLAGDALRVLELNAPDHPLLRELNKKSAQDMS